MQFDDDSYYKAYDHNYRVAYEEGLTYCGEGGNQKPALDRLAALLKQTGLVAPGVKVLDIGCGDGTEGIFLAGLGYSYTGIDISPAAVERARQRATDVGMSADFRVANAMDLSAFAIGEFPLVIDSYCFHCHVIDRHREAYFRSVKRIMHDNGVFILRATISATACQTPINSFKDFCRQSGADIAGVILQKCVRGEWQKVPDKRQYLFGRAWTMDEYRKEFTDAGFVISHHEIYEWKKPPHVAFLLKKVHPMAR